MSNVFLDKVFINWLKKNSIVLEGFATCVSDRDPTITFIYYKYKFFSKYAPGKHLYFYGALEFNSNESISLVADRFVKYVKSIPLFFNKSYNNPKLWTDFISHQIDYKFRFENVDNGIVYRGSRHAALLLERNCICLIDLMLDFENINFNEIQPGQDFYYNQFQLFFMRKFYKYQKTIRRFVNL